MIAIPNINEEFVIHYGGALHSVDATTFAGSLSAIARVFEEANYLLFPDFKVEIRVEALAEGSFRPKIRLYSKAASDKVINYLPEKKELIFVVLAILSLCQCGGGDTYNITVSGNNVVFEGSSSNLMLPKQAYDKAVKISESKTIKAAISQNFAVIDGDSSITSFGFAQDVSSEDYLFYEDHKNFKKYINTSNDEHGDIKREVAQHAELRLLKVILEKGLRKWEFVWNGIKISAPITDDGFWNDLRLQKISISQGDSIEVDLKIYQTKDPYSQIFINDGYEVIKVKNYHKALQQRDDLFDKVISDLTSDDGNSKN